MGRAATNEAAYSGKRGREKIRAKVFMKDAVGGYVGRSKTSRGATLVEFALALLLFAPLMCAICDFGCYFFVQHTLQWATREGERLGLVGGTLTDSQGNMETTTQSIVDTIKKYAGVAVDTSKLTISIFPLPPPYTTNPAGWQTMQDAGNPGDYMRVITQYQYTFFTPFLAYFFPPNGGIGIQSEATYRNEQF